MTLLFRPFQPKTFSWRHKNKFYKIFSLQNKTYSNISIEKKHTLNVQKKYKDIQKSREHVHKNTRRMCTVYILTLDRRNFWHDYETPYPYRSGRRKTWTTFEPTFRYCSGILEFLGTIIFLIMIILSPSIFCMVIGTPGIGL